MPAKQLRLTLPLSFAGLGAVYYGISMFNLAGGNTALAVAANVEFVPALAGMLIRVAPWVILPTVLYLVYRLREFFTEDDDGQIVVILMVLALLAAIYYSSVLTLVICAGALIFHLTYMLSVKRNWKRKPRWARFNPELARQMMATLLLAAVSFGPSWLARETAVVADKQRVISVIKETDHFVYYLDDKTRRVVYAKTSDVTERAFCGSGDLDTVNSLVRLFYSDPVYPTCPKMEGLQASG